MAIYERIRQLREEAGLTKTALAKPKYTVSYVSQIEAGRRNPSSEALSFFADRLGVTPDFLVTGIPEGAEERLRYQLEEARRNVRAGQAEEADRILQTVLAEAGEYDLTRLRAETLVMIAESTMRAGDMRAAVDLYEEALESGLPTRLAGMAISGLARAYRSVGDLSYAMDLVQGHLERHGEGPMDPAVAAELQSVLVSLYFERGDMLRAEQASERALAAAKDVRSPEIRANAYWDASRVLAEARRWDEALELATAARTLMEELEDRRAAARLHNVSAFLCLEADPPRVVEARKHLQTAERELKKIGTPADLAYVYSERARLALLQGEPEGALRDADLALENVGSDELERARCLFLRGRALASLDRSSEAEDSLREAASIFKELGARQQEAACWRELGELVLRTGDASRAMDALRNGLVALDPSRSRA